MDVGTDQCVKGAEEGLHAFTWDCDLEWLEREEVAYYSNYAVVDDIPKLHGMGYK